MEKHPYFDLWLHSSAELAHLLGSPVVERQVLQEWPLSCVQRLRLADGQRWIYKSQQTSSSVEAEFYAQARSAWLPGCRRLGAFQGTTYLLFEVIEAPLLEALPLAEADILRHAQRLTAGIAALETQPGQLPVFTDLGSPARWREYVARTLARLNELVTGAAGRPAPYTHTRPADIAALTAWASSPAILSLFAAPPTYNHGDLAGDNVFVTPDGYKVIDWQRPLRGPAGFDQVTLYESLEIDPRRYLGAGLVQAAWFVRLRWFVDCQVQFFTAGDYDAQIAELAGQIVKE